jgi:hypothetical protein
LAKEGSFLVYTGQIPAGYDILKAIDEGREERMRQILGQVAVDEPVSDC